MVDHLAVDIISFWLHYLIPGISGYFSPKPGNGFCLFHSSRSSVLKKQHHVQKSSRTVAAHHSDMKLGSSKTMMIGRIFAESWLSLSKRET